MNKFYNLNNIYDLDKIKNNDEITDPELLSKLEVLFNIDISKIGEIHPFLLRWLIQKFEQMNRLSENFSGQRLKSTTVDNLYNFALAKQSNFIDTVKMIKRSDLEFDLKISKLKKTANLFFNTQQKVEEEQVKHITEVTEKIFREGSRNMLKYISEGDSNVRPEHKKADGVILPANHPFWNNAFNLLSEWNCRCQIIPVEEDEKMVLPPKNLKIPSSSKVPSDINLDVQKGKVIIFKEELDVFKNRPDVVRKLYRKNGF